MTTISKLNYALYMFTLNIKADVLFNLSNMFRSCKWLDRMAWHAACDLEAEDHYHKEELIKNAEEARFDAWCKETGYGIDDTIYNVNGTVLHERTM